MLEIVQRSHKTCSIKAAQTIVELIDLAEREEALNLTYDEIAFYDALETNDSAIKVILREQ